MRLLDAFCCEGGAGMGYHRAGFEVTGIDLNPRFSKRYPFEFIEGDAIEYIRRHGHEYDAIHASPPCQRYTHGNVAGKQAGKHPDLIAETRAALFATGRPYVLENVPRAPLLNPLVLCWSMFHVEYVPDTDGTPLVMRRHRLFESNRHLWAPNNCVHPKGVQIAGSYGGARRDKHEARHIRKGGYVPARVIQESLLGIDWMSEHGLYQSIPPAYTQWIGEQLWS